MGWDDRELISAKLEKPTSVIDGLFTTGLTIFGAAPKIGKSEYLMNVAADITYGTMHLGSFPVSQGEVLFLGLEDSGKLGALRLQLRLQGILVARGAEPNGKLQIENSWKRANEGGAKKLVNWRRDFPNAKMIVIDMLRLYDPPRGWSYVDDSEKIQALNDLALALDICIVAVHHTNRQGSKKKDWVEDLQGTLGVSGAATNIMKFERERGQTNCLLRATGKDIDEIALPLAYDPDTGIYSIRDDTEISQEGAVIAMSDERKEILKFVNDNPALTAPEVAQGIGKSYNNIRHLLWAMKEQRQVENVGGRYYTPEQAKKAKLIEDEPQMSFAEQSQSELLAKILAQPEHPTDKWVRDKRAS